MKTEGGIPRTSRTVFPPPCPEGRVLHPPSVCVVAKHASVPDARGVHSLPRSRWCNTICLLRPRGWLLPVFTGAAKVRD
jgi:hypothetical protein